MANDISDALRAEVLRRAGGRCEYCGIEESDAGFPFQIDHIVSRKHGGSSEPGNLACACAPCNWHKGTDVATVNLVSRRVVRLFNPRRDRWADHFFANRGVIEPLTPVGAATTRLLQMNLPERVSERYALGSRVRPPT